MQNTLSVSECVKFGWETFKKRPWLFIGTLLVYAVISGISGSIASSAAEQGGVLALILNAFDMLVVQVLAAMGLVAFTLRFHDDASAARVQDLWAPKMYWSFLGMTVLSLILVILGLIALIIPGIILALGFMFAQYLVIDKDRGAVESLKESWRITKGNRFNLFIFVLVLTVINILGALALLVGLLVSIPVTMLAVVHAYRTLEHKASEIAPAAVIAPAVA